MKERDISPEAREVEKKVLELFQKKKKERKDWLTECEERTEKNHEDLEPKGAA